jgi:hypothetical protein
LIEVSAGLDPLVEFPPAVHDDLVPGLRLFLDDFAVPQPADVGGGVFSYQPFTVEALGVR